MNTNMNPRDGGFPELPKMYISILKLVGFASSAVTRSFNQRGGISTQGSKKVNFSG